MTFTSPDRIRTHVGVVLACVPALSLSPALSANGRYVAFESYSPDMTGETDPYFVLTHGVFVHDTVTGDTYRMDIGVDGHLSTTGQNPDISADGRYVALTSRRMTNQGDSSTSDVYLSQLW